MQGSQILRQNTSDNSSDHANLRTLQVEQKHQTADFNSCISGAVSSDEGDSGSDPMFAGPINNVTVNVGREAVLECHVNSLGQYKVG